MLILQPLIQMEGAVGVSVNLLQEKQISVLIAQNALNFDHISLNYFL